MNFALIALSFAAFPAFAAEQAPAELPAQLNCREVLNVFGNDTLESYRFDLANPRDFKIVQNKDNNSVTLDFNDGDQIDYVTFRREDIASLVARRTPTVRGFRISGFWHADGDHMEEMTVLECTL